MSGNGNETYDSEQVSVTDLMRKVLSLNVMPMPQVIEDHLSIWKLPVVIQLIADGQDKYLFIEDCDSLNNEMKGFFQITEK